VGQAFWEEGVYPGAFLHVCKCSERMVLWLGSIVAPLYFPVGF